MEMGIVECYPPGILRLLWLSSPLRAHSEDRGWNLSVSDPTTALAVLDMDSDSNVNFDRGLSLENMTSRDIRQKSAAFTHERM